MQVMKKNCIKYGRMIYRSITWRSTYQTVASVAFIAAIWLSYTPHYKQYVFLYNYAMMPNSCVSSRAKREAFSHAVALTLAADDMRLYANASTFFPFLAIVCPLSPYGFLAITVQCGHRARPRCLTIGLTTTFAPGPLNSGLIRLYIVGPALVSA
jgi:hypothetical protein